MAVDEAIETGSGRVRLTFRPDGGDVRVPAGTTVFDAASWNGIAIDSTCGGHGACKKCKGGGVEGSLPVSSGGPPAVTIDEPRPRRGAAGPGAAGGGPGER